MEVRGKLQTSGLLNFVGDQWDSITIVDDIVNFATPPTADGLYIDLSSGDFMYKDNNSVWHPRTPTQWEYAYVRSTNGLYQFDGASWVFINPGTPEVIIGSITGGSPVPAGADIGVYSFDRKMFYRSASNTWSATRYNGFFISNSNITLSPNMVYVLSSDVAVTWTLGSGFQPGDTVEVVNTSSNGTVRLVTTGVDTIGGKTNLLIDNEPPYVCRIVYAGSNVFAIELGFGLDKKSGWKTLDGFSYTASTSGPTMPTTYFSHMHYRVFGRRLQIKFNYNHTTGSSDGGTGIYRVEIPGGYQADVANLDTYVDLAGAAPPNQIPYGSVVGYGVAEAAVGSDRWIGNVIVMVWDVTQLCFMIDRIMIGTDHETQPGNMQQNNWFSVDNDDLRIFAEIDIPIVV